MNPIIGIDEILKSEIEIRVIPSIRVMSLSTDAIAGLSFLFIWILPLFIYNSIIKQKIKNVNRVLKK